MLNYDLFGLSINHYTVKSRKRTAKSSIPQITSYTKKVTPLDIHNVNTSISRIYPISTDMIRQGTVLLKQQQTQDFPMCEPYTTAKQGFCNILYTFSIKTDRIFRKV